MPITTTVPVNITPEAAAHLAALGYQREFEQMLDHTLKTVPRIQRVDVHYEPDPEGADIPKIVIQPTQDPGLNPIEDRCEDEWSWWKINTFPPQIAEHFLMMTVYGHADER